MYAEFEQLPENARLWIYQAERELTVNEVTQAETYLHRFAEEWVAHALPLKTSFKILYNRFIILAADESFNDVSGCSIDSAVRAIKDLGSKLKVDFMGRDQVFFEKGDRIIGISVKELKEKYQAGVWNANSVTFNTLAAIKKRSRFMENPGKRHLAKTLPASSCSHAKGVVNFVVLRYILEI